MGGWGLFRFARHYAQFSLTDRFPVLFPFRLVFVIQHHQIYCIHHCVLCIEYKSSFLIISKQNKQKNKNRRSHASPVLQSEPFKRQSYDDNGKEQLSCMILNATMTQRGRSERFELCAKWFLYFMNPTHSDL